MNDKINDCINVIYMNAELSIIAANKIGTDNADVWLLAQHIKERSESTLKMIAELNKLTNINHESATTYKRKD